MKKFKPLIKIIINELKIKQNESEITKKKKKTNKQLIKLQNYVENF